MADTEPTQHADTGRMAKGEFLDVDGQELKPYDVLGEGRVIRTVHGTVGWGSMDVGPCHAEVEVIELADGPRCLWSPVWGEVHRESVPRGTVRVLRGAIPGFFCTAEPGGQSDPCDSDRCPIRNAQIDGEADA